MSCPPGLSNCSSKQITGLLSSVITISCSLVGICTPGQTAEPEINFAGVLSPAENFSVPDSQNLTADNFQGSFDGALPLQLAETATESDVYSTERSNQLSGLSSLTEAIPTGSIPAAIETHSLELQPTSELGEFAVSTELEPLQPLSSSPVTAGSDGTADQEADVLNHASALELEAIEQPITEPNLDFQGLYIFQDDQSSARARLLGSAFLTPNLLVGGAIDFVTGPDLTNDDGIQITELYLATALPGTPGLRFRVGQLDLTSYFDRNSFAKDISRDFFNPIFHTNPALIAGANVTASRPAGLVQWAITDDLLVSASAFSSAPNLSDFALDGFAGEVSVRSGDLIVRGTFVSAKDTEFQGTGGRLNSYGINAEWFIPSANLGFFGRYGHLDNASTGLSTDTYSIGLNALDLFMPNDRLGLAYGRNLLTAAADERTPDALEVFYDFEVFPSIRIGFTLQQRNAFTETVAGFRIRGDLGLFPEVSLED